MASPPRSAPDASDPETGPSDGTGASSLSERAIAKVRPFDLLESLPVISWACDSDGQCTYLSPKWAEYTGTRNDEQLGWKWLDCVHPEDRERLGRSSAEALLHSDDHRMVYRIRRHDGVYRWFASHGRAERDADGKVVRWCGCTFDIHEEHERRAAFSDEHELLEHIIATAPGTFFALKRSPDGVYSHPAASPAIEKLLGAPGPELANDADAALDLVHPDDRARVREAIERSAMTLEPWTIEHRFMHPTEGELWIEPHAIPVRQPDGSVIWHGFLRDVTERRRAEASLRATQGQLVAALEAGGMGIWSWNAESDRVRIDDSFLKLVGGERAELQGTRADLDRFVHPDDAALLSEMLDSLRARADDRKFEYRVLTQQNEVRWLLATAHGTRDTLHGLTVTMLHVDVSEQKRASEARLRSQKLEALGTLAGGIAHDFNNMLHAICGNTALAMRTLPPNAPARNYLDAVSVAGARASDLVRRILAFSRPGDQRTEVLNLRSVVGEALKLVRAAVPANIELRTDLGNESLHVDAEVTQVHQIVLNLATNAAHAIGTANGLLHLSLAPLAGLPDLVPPPDLPAGDYAVLRVSDSGCGMSPAVMERIFDPFFTTKPVGQGTGLGLSVVHGIMTSLGGAVTVSSAVDRGTTFTLYFPLAETRRDTPSRHPPPEAATRGGTVMFVDDEPLLVELGVATLASLGYEVVGRQRPREALRDIMRDPQRFDVLITDIAMPDLSGFELAARVRELLPRFPVVMMSGNVGLDELASAEQLGVQELLLKPVGIDTLAAALERVLRAAGRTVRH